MDSIWHDEISDIAYSIWETKNLSQPTTKEVEIENWLEAEKIWFHHLEHCKPRSICDCEFDLPMPG